MSLYFLDTSALVKLYVEEPGTDRLLQLAGNFSQNRFAVLSVSVVEARSAIRRRQRAGDISKVAADAILDNLQAHMASKFLQQAINNTLIDIAIEMIDRHGLRAYDSLQLAGCLLLGAIEPRGVTFVCADRELLNAARQEQLGVLDPTA